MSDNITTAKMQEESQQNSPLMKLPTELRLEICKHAFQHDMEILDAAPIRYKSVKHPYRGALALLCTSRTLRTECLDAVEPIAIACRDAFRAEADLLRVDAKALNALFPSRSSARDFHAAFVLRSRLAGRRIGVEKIEGVCGLLVASRKADEKLSAA